MVVRKLRTFYGLSRLERRLTLSTIALTASVRLGLWLVPFRTMRSICEKFAQGGKRPAGTAPEADIVRAVRLSSRYVPRASCLVQALTTQILMGRNGHPVQVHIGVALNRESGFRAHAWVESQGRVLVGQVEELASYAPMLVLDAALHKQPKNI